MLWGLPRQGETFRLLTVLQTELTTQALGSGGNQKTLAELELRARVEGSRRARDSREAGLLLGDQELKPALWSVSSLCSSSIEV